MLNQKTKLRRAFEAGKKLSAKQISNYFNIASPTKIVSMLRMEDGLPIYRNKHVDTKGRVVYKYTMGTFSKRVLAAGYQALARGLV